MATKKNDRALKVVEDLPVKKGDKFWSMGCEATVLRASKTWVDLLVRQVKTGDEWKKRMTLPLPESFERLPEVDLELHEFDPQWTIHPGVFWRDLANESEMSQAEIARQMGVSQKHLSQILTCTVTPGVESTVKFAQVVGAPVRTLWNLACDYKLALALGKKDVTRDYL